MITIRVFSVAQDENTRQDFFRSLRAHASPAAEYEVIGKEAEPAAESEVVIQLPDTVLVLGKDWDRYVRYWVTNDRPLDLDFIRRRFALQSRGGETEFQHIVVDVKKKDAV